MVVPDATRTRVAARAADPVVVEPQTADGAGGSGIGIAPYVMALALWLGALVAFLVLPAGRRGRGRRWWVGPIAAFAASRRPRHRGGRPDDRRPGPRRGHGRRVAAGAHPGRGARRRRLHGDDPGARRRVRQPRLAGRAAPGGRPGGRMRDAVPGGLAPGHRWRSSIHSCRSRGPPTPSARASRARRPGSPRPCSSSRDRWWSPCS